MTTRLTYNDMLSAYGHYPAPIRPYLLRAETHPGIRSILTKSFLRVFVDVLSRAPIADPSRPIKVRVDAVASRLNVSVKTVSRTLRLMRNNFWLSPAPSHDGRNNYGEFAAREYIIDTPLRHLLGLPDAPQASSASSETEPDADSQIDRSDATMASPDSSDANGTQHSHSDNEAQARGEDGVNKSGIETKMSDGPIMVNKVFSKEASFKDAEGGKKTAVPHDLTPLHTELGISLLGICSLMRLAKDTNQRLQDIWHAKREVILNSGAKEGRAVQYFRWLLQCGEDFSYIARCKVPQALVATPQRSQDKHGNSQGDSQGIDLVAIAARCRYKKYVHVRTGMRVRFFDGTAEVSQDGHFSIYAGEQMTGLYRGVSKGNLRLVVE